MIDGDIEQFLAVAERALRAIDSLLDFAGSVGGSSSYWEEVWPEHETAVSALWAIVARPASTR